MPGGAKWSNTAQRLLLLRVDLHQHDVDVVMPADQRAAHEREVVIAIEAVEKRRQALALAEPVLALGAFAERGLESVE
jgi:hypothetical protein